MTLRSLKNDSILGEVTDLTNSPLWHYMSHEDSHFCLNSLNEEFVTSTISKKVFSASVQDIKKDALGNIILCNP